VHARSLFLINKPQGKSIVPETTCEHFFKPFQNEKNSRVKVNETRHFNDHSYFLVPAQKMIIHTLKATIFLLLPWSALKLARLFGDARKESNVSLRLFDFTALAHTLTHPD